MLFALLDYRHYRNRTGRFARHHPRSNMAFAWEGEFPEQVTDMLEVGDPIAMLTFDSWQSWLITYLTRSEISHVAFYAGERQIAHATLYAGVIREPIESLFGANSRLLPCKVGTALRPDGAPARPSVLPRHDAEGYPYPIASVVCKGLKIIMGRNWPLFRWAFAFDAALLCVLFDAPIIALVGFPVASWLLALYVVQLPANWWLSRRYPIKINSRDGVPADILTVVRATGGCYLLDGFAMHQQLGQAERPSDPPA